MYGIMDVRMDGLMVMLLCSLEGLWPKIWYVHHNNTASQSLAEKPQVLSVWDWYFTRQNRSKKENTRNAL